MSLKTEGKSDSQKNIPKIIKKYEIKSNNYIHSKITYKAQYRPELQLPKELELTPMMPTKMRLQNWTLSFHLFFLINPLMP